MNLKCPPIPDEIGLQPQNELSDGEGDVDGDADEGGEFCSNALDGDDEGHDEEAFDRKSGQETEKRESLRSIDKCTYTKVIFINVNIIIFLIVDTGFSSRHICGLLYWNI